MKIKALIIFLFCLVSTRIGQAQIVFDLLQEIEQGISTVTSVANVVTNIANNVQKFEQLYKKINDGIKTYHRVKSIITNTQYSIQAIYSGLNYLKSAKNLRPAQIANMVKVYQYYLDQLQNNITDLTNMVSEMFNMNDAERMKAIQKIESKTVALATSANYVDNKIKVADMTLGSQKQDLQDVKDYYTALAADEASKTDTPESAAKNLSGIYGDIAKFLYAISAIIALVGAVKVYGQFTSGSDQVWQTCVSWFGACLALVTLTTFINILF